MHAELRLNVITRLMLFFTVLMISQLAQATPAIQTWQTSNGANVFYVPAHELPMMDVRVVFNAGSARDDEKWGVAALTNALLAEGAGGLSAQAISEAFEDVGAQLGYGSLMDMAWASVRTLSDASKREVAVRTLSKVISQADFPEDAFVREQSRTLIGLEQEKQDPSAIANKAFFSAVYGDHPYAHPMNGTQATVEALSRDDIVAFYKEYYVAKNAVVAIVGDVSRSEAEAIADQLVSKLSEGEAAAAVPEVEPLAEAKEIRIAHPSSQSTIIVGQPGVKRGDQDYFDLYVGNHSLGGSSLVSRLSIEIRENRGLTYGVYSYFTPMAQPGPFISSMQTRNDQVEEGLTVLKDTIEDYVNNGQTEAEYSASMKNITGGFPMRIDSNKEIVEYLGMIGFYGMPLDYLDMFIINMESVTLASAREAMQRRLDPEKMVTVIVGGDAQE